MNPFDLLEVAEDADDKQVKTAYLSKIKQFVPEHYPQQFQQIQAAYQQIKEQDSRVKYQLLKTPEFDLSLITQHLLPSANCARPDSTRLLALLQHSALKMPVHQQTGGQ